MSPVRRMKRGRNVAEGDGAKDEVAAGGRVVTVTPWYVVEKKL